LSADSTGFKVCGEGAWQALKQGLQGRRPSPAGWNRRPPALGRKGHRTVDTAMSGVRATSGRSRSPPGKEGLRPVLPDLRGRSPDDGDLGTPTADGACDTPRCRTAILAHVGTADLPL
jgi:hypothetical protein